MERGLCLISLLLITGSLVFSYARKEFSVEGEIKGLKNGSKLFLVINRGGKIDTVSSATTKGGLFLFKKVALSEYPDFCTITIQTEFVNDLKLFINQEENVQIVGDLKTWPEVKVTGSKTHSDYQTYLRYEKTAKRITDSLRFSLDIGVKKQDQVRAARLPFILSHPNSYVLPYALLLWLDLDGYGVHPAYIRGYYDQLPTKVKQSKYGRKLKDVLFLAESESVIKPGGMFPRIVVLDDVGKIATIPELIKKNKVTLIDCWSSSCLPCRKAFPEIEKILGKYRDKGFGVLGISSDIDLVAWKSALAQDKTSWPNYIQVDQSLSKTFKLMGIGAQFLLDGEGKVIAFDGLSENVRSFGGGLSYEELNTKLEELLGKN